MSHIAWNTPAQRAWKVAALGTALGGLLEFDIERAILIEQGPEQFYITVRGVLTFRLAGRYNDVDAAKRGVGIWLNHMAEREVSK